MQRPERERKEPTEFNVIVKAKDLVKHTFTITNSTERYPKKYRFTLVNRIQDKAVDIYECVLEANELDLRDAQEYRQRQKLQAKALTYFYSIRHDVLKTLIREKITDPDVLWLIDLIIDSTEGNVGIPIGNQTSQLFALLYLDGLDHFVKEKLGIKYYGRYMDDFFLIHHDKAYLQECRKQIEAFVQARGLSLNAKTNIFPLKHGVDFLGFHTYLTESGAVIRKVRRRSKNNMKRKLKKLAALHAAGRIDAKTVEQSYQSWRGHAEKGNSYHLIRRTDQYYNSLMKSKEAAQCQKH